MVLFYAAVGTPLLKAVFGYDNLHQAGQALPLLGLAMTLLACTYLSVQYLLALHRSSFVWILATGSCVELVGLLGIPVQLVNFALVVLAVQFAIAVAVVGAGYRRTVPRPGLDHDGVPGGRRRRDPGGQRPGGARAGGRPSGRRADRRRRRPAARGRERGRSLLLEPARAHAKHARRDRRDRAHPQARRVGLHLLDELVLALGRAPHESRAVPQTAPRPAPVRAPARTAAHEPIRRRTVAGALGAHPEGPAA